jgi:hypothetical protein
LVKAGHDADRPPMVNVFGAMLGVESLKHELVLDPDASTATADAGRRWLTKSWAMVHPCGSRGVYPNFPDSELENAGRAHYRTNLERLIRVKRKYGPDDVFGVGLAGAPLAD